MDQLKKKLEYKWIGNNPIYYTVKIWITYLGPKF